MAVSPAPLTHANFEAPQGLVRVSVHVVVDRTARAGLNFFALQVDFNNGTWANGGLQTGDEHDGVRGRQVNWGGLVDRGGGNADYDQENVIEDIEKIQNPPAGQHIGQYPWREGEEYEYIVERGNLVTLPPGEYRYFPDREPVRLTRARQMWEWRFIVRPVTVEGAPFEAMLYDSADAIETFCVWNESGYGSTDAEQHTGWSRLTYRVANSTEDRTPGPWARF